MIDFAPLTGWDWFVLAALLISTALGLISGLVRTVFALAAWAIALIGAPIFAPALLQATGIGLHPLFAMAILFFALFIGVRLIGHLLLRALSKVGLRGVDRVLGGLLGMARALVIITVVAVVARAAGAQNDTSWQLALSKPLLDRLVALVDPWLPEQISGVRRV